MLSDIFYVRWDPTRCLCVSFVGVAVVCSHRHSHRHRSPRYRSFSIKSIGSQPKLKLVDCSIPKSAGPLHLRSFSFASVYLWPCTSAFVCVHSGFLFHSNRRSTPPPLPHHTSQVSIATAAKAFSSCSPPSPCDSVILVITAIACLFMV